MATHSSVLAWRIPGMGEPGGLPSMGSHRVGHDWSDLAVAAYDLPRWKMALVIKGLPASAGETRSADLIPGSGRCPGGGNGNPLQYSCLETPMNRGAWWARVHGSQRVGHDWNDSAHSVWPHFNWRPYLKMQSHLRCLELGLQHMIFSGWGGIQLITIIS